ncbi:CbtA family protein [Pseudomonas abietaniphila]|uniref:Uncharacterized membrane protein, predicted cobalt tansporter CbtA n=1 Tax=Pseudomonas abietaniphila TaxID=89065 RepID=A0A1G8PUR9_9PSED|nr:CbtA family protein [Pseudomonas abietaniphila]SDI96163.1 Uncharacterized membrane protein, predicted cobalt tansporter CbtA [Pseudomonas abietaniphila]
MIGRLLLRGMFAGLLAGILAFGVAKIYGEPPLSRSIAVEESAEHAHGDAVPLHVHGAAEPAHVHKKTDSSNEEELVSRRVQSTVGLFTGIAVYSISLGGIFALVFAYSLGRFGRIRPRSLSLLLALAAFVAVILIPALKYPPNPPPAGLLETIGKRTTLFFLMMLVSISAMVISMSAGRKLVVRFGRVAGTVRAAIMYLIIVALAGYLFPSVDEVPESFSVSLLIEFRVASMGIQLVLWASMALIFGWYADRALKSYRW